MLKLVLLATAAAAIAAPAAADSLFRGSLSGDQETVPNDTTATGEGLVRLSDDQNFIDVSLSWVGLVAPAAAGHIHCCAFLGANGPVAIDLEPVPQITGSIFASFDLTDISTYAGGFLAANGGTAEGARAALLAGLTSGGAYFNIHNQPFPGGQIRGQIEGAIPEPASWALMIAGFGLVGGALRRRTAAVAA